MWEVNFNCHAGEKWNLISLIYNAGFSIENICFMCLLITFAWILFTINYVFYENYSSMCELTEYTNRRSDEKRMKFNKIIKFLISFINYDIISYAEGELLWRALLTIRILSLKLQTSAWLSGLTFMVCTDERWLKWKIHKIKFI